MNAMKIASSIVAIVVALYTILLLVQLWASVVSTTLFLKITVTAVVVIIATLGLAMLYREYIEEKSMKDDMYLD